MKKLERRNASLVSLEVSLYSRSLVHLEAVQIRPRVLVTLRKRFKGNAINLNK